MVVDMSGETIVLVVACALIDIDGRVLISQRPEGKAMAGLWEFPGGKVEPGERPETALIRELREELGIDVTAACLAPLDLRKSRISLVPSADAALCVPALEGGVRPGEGQRIAWVRPMGLRAYPMPPADIPLVAHLIDAL